MAPTPSPPLKILQFGMIPFAFLMSSLAGVAPDVSALWSPRPRRIRSGCHNHTCRNPCFWKGTNVLSPASWLYFFAGDNEEEERQNVGQRAPEMMTTTMMMQAAADGSCRGVTASVHARGTLHQVSHRGTSRWMNLIKCEEIEIGPFEHLWRALKEMDGNLLCVLNMC